MFDRCARGGRGQGYYRQQQAWCLQRENATRGMGKTLLDVRTPRDVAVAGLAGACALRPMQSQVSERRPCKRVSVCVCRERTRAKSSSKKGEASQVSQGKAATAVRPERQSDSLNQSL